MSLSKFSVLTAICTTSKRLLLLSTMCASVRTEANERFKSCDAHNYTILANDHRRSGKRHSQGIATVSDPCVQLFCKISRWHLPPLFPLSACRSQPCTLVLLVFSSPCCHCERSCTVVARARRLTSGTKTYQQPLSFRALSG